MKTRSLSCLMAAGVLFAFVNQSSGDDIPGLYGTGVLDNGTPAPEDTYDVHYIFASSPLASERPGVYMTVGYCHNTFGSYMTNGPLTQWIGPGTQPCLYVIGTYVYRTTFDLTGLIPETARISGRWCAEASDTGRILLNGTQMVSVTHFQNPGVLVPFAITNGFLSGTNALDFEIGNYTPSVSTDPTGLRVEISGKAYNPNGPPDLSIRVSEVELCWPAAADKTYQVQYRSDLTTNLWANLGNTIPGTNGFVCVRDAITSVQRFYRLQLVP